MKQPTEKKQISEGIISNFIEKFFDSYKRGLEKQFIDTTKQRDPRLAQTLSNIDAEIQSALVILHDRVAKMKKK